MFEYLRTILKKKGVPTELVDKHISDLLQVIVFAFLGESESLLGVDERKLIQDKLVRKDFDAICPIIQKKYSPEAWERFIDKVVPPILDDYFNSVLIN